MDPLNEDLSLLSRIERFAAVHLDPDPLVQAKFLSLVSALIDAGFEAGRKVGPKAP
jgi:hypothetical protein